MIKTWMGNPTPERGGRSKRMVRVLAKGMEAAAAFYDAVLKVSHGTSWQAGTTGVRE
jgi:hypothetical protein